MKKMIVCLFGFLLSCNNPQESRTSQKIISEQEISDDIRAMHSAKVNVMFLNDKKPQIMQDNLAHEKLTEVTRLDFLGENVCSIPDWWLVKFTQLSELNLHDAGLSAREAVKLKELKTLKKLDLSNNPLFLDADDDTLTELWPALSNLQDLNLANLKGTAANFGDFSKLTALKKLDLSGNALTEIKPLNLSGLHNLTSLNLAYNKLETFSFQDISSNSLEELDLQHNAIGVLPFKQELAKLRKLNLRGNSKIAVDEAYGGLFVLHQLTELQADMDAQIPLGLQKKLPRNNFLKSQK